MINNSFFSTEIIRWFRENGRDLPWRETRDPYAIWLSEIILQQTRIAQGWEYWERFMQTYPHVEDLAAASEDDVLKLWQGLGYYSRARNLHAAARQIVALGEFPNTLDGIKSLKGVGDYTAAAIGSFAFNLPAAVVDGNVYRVLSRYFGIDTPINSTQGKKEFAALAQSLLPASEAAAYNQGMMDFGAIQCTPQSPKCLLCPLAETCEALRSGRVEELPVKNKTVKVKTRHLSYVYIRYKAPALESHAETAIQAEVENFAEAESHAEVENHAEAESHAETESWIAIHRRGEGDIWQGLWEPYNMSDMKELPSFVKDPILLAKDVKHVLTHRILLADFYLLEVEDRPSLPDDYIWIKESEIENYGVPRLIEIMLEKIHQ